MMQPEDQIMFQGRDWLLLKGYLNKQRDLKLQMLVSAVDHDSSNRIRGALGMIQALLALESAAEQAAKRNSA